MSSTTLKTLSISAIVLAAITGSLFIATARIEAIPVKRVIPIAQVAVEPQPAAQVSTSAQVTTPQAAVESTPVSTAQPSTPVTAPTYQWADAMALAGINTSDYGYVTDMVLDANGWRTTGPNLWQHALSAGSNQPLEFNLARVNYYVTITYGSWASADATWAATGDF